MALQRLTFRVAGETQLSRAFEALDREMDDLREPLRDAAGVLKRSVGQQFLTEGAHGGGPWQALNARYRAWKESHFGPGLPILVRTRKLRSSLLEGDRAIIELTPKRLTWGVPPAARYPDGTPVETVAEAHQAGKGHQPQRRIIQLTAADRRSVEREFHEWLISRRRRMIGT